MGSSSTTALCFFIVVSVTFGAKDAAVTPPPLTKTSHFILALQWPKSVCSARNAAPSQITVVDSMADHKIVVDSMVHHLRFVMKQGSPCRQQPVNQKVQKLAVEE